MIILISGFFEVYDKLPLKNIKKVAFIGNAKDKHADKSGLEKYRRFFREKYSVFEDVDLRKYNSDSLFKKLSTFDLIYVAGGNSFVLMEAMRKSGFDTIIKKLLDFGIIYLGQSAGACVMGSSIEPFKLYDRPEKANLKNFDGFGFVDFVFVPHDGNPRFADRVNILKKTPPKGFKLEFFTDEEAIIINKGLIKRF
jgi:dipeptidase E